MKKVVAVHLFNDYSGSPLVLSQVLEGFIEKGFEVDLYTSKHSGTGFLTHVEGLNNYSYTYKWHPNKWMTLYRFMTSQIGLFFKLRKYKNEDVVFYVNTILPFGAALAGRMIKKPVIYHIHETSVKPAPFKKFLFKMLEKCSSKSIYVSNFLAKEEPIPSVEHEVVYNAISQKFIDKVEIESKENFIALMLCSLKEYKGVWQFIKLAKRISEIQFELVLNAEQYEIDEFFKDYTFPENLTLFSAQSNVHPFYKRASLVMNLSLPDQWVETFGMTAIEAFAYKIPFISPPVGGIIEVVDDGVNGFHVDSRDLDLLEFKVRNLVEDRDLYNKFSESTDISLKRFSIKELQQKTINLIEKVG